MRVDPEPYAIERGPLILTSARLYPFAEANALPKCDTPFSTKLKKRLICTFNTV